MTDPRTGIRHLTATRACARQPQTIGAIDPQELAALQCVFFDCDGVMTDGRVWVDASGHETKAFSVIDGHGVWMLRGAGVKVGLITRDRSGIPAVRARKLQFDVIHGSIDDKGSCVRAILVELGLSRADVGYMGDDIPDLGAFEEVGLRLAPYTARPEVIAASDGVTVAPGGQGAVREVCDAIIAALRLAV